jgi:hypothetical protein
MTFTDISNDLDIIAHQIVGPSLYLLAGLGIENTECGVIGNGECYDKVRVSHINGILNNHLGCREAVEMISQLHGGVNVHYTYRPTAGWTGDLFNAFIARMGFVSPTARCLADNWRKLINEMGGPSGGGLIIHYAHSQGGVETICAKQLMTPEELRMIRVITFGSPKVVLREAFSSATNYVSRRDGVSLLDPMGLFGAIAAKEAAVVFVGSHSGLPIIDHPLANENYLQILTELGRRFASIGDGIEFDDLVIPIGD